MPKTWRMVLFITDEGETPKKQSSEGIVSDVEVYLTKEEIEALITDPLTKGIRMELNVLEEGEFIEYDGRKIFRPTWTNTGTGKGDSNTTTKTDKSRSRWPF